MIGKIPVRSKGRHEMAEFEVATGPQDLGEVLAVEAKDDKICLYMPAEPPMKLVMSKEEAARVEAAIHERLK